MAGATGGGIGERLVNPQGGTGSPPQGHLALPMREPLVLPEGVGNKALTEIREQTLDRLGQIAPAMFSLEQEIHQGGESFVVGLGVPHDAGHRARDGHPFAQTELLDDFLGNFQDIHGSEPSKTHPAIPTSLPTCPPRHSQASEPPSLSGARLNMRPPTLLIFSHSPPPFLAGLGGEPRPFTTTRQSQSRDGAHIMLTPCALVQ